MDKRWDETTNMITQMGRCNADAKRSYEVLQEARVPAKWHFMGLHRLELITTHQNISTQGKLLDPTTHATVFLPSARTMLEIRAPG